MPKSSFVLKLAFHSAVQSDIEKVPLHIVARIALQPQPHRSSPRVPQHIHSLSRQLLRLLLRALHNLTSLKSLVSQYPHPNPSYHHLFQEPLTFSPTFAATPSAPLTPSFAFSSKLFSRPPIYHQLINLYACVACAVKLTAWQPNSK